MLSILIPIFNHSAVALIKELLTQAESINETIEIICCDDNSTNAKIKKENSSFLDTQNITFITNTKNIGRTKTRQTLAEAANYDWLLFLDADVMPSHSFFIKTYLKLSDQNYTCIYGGLSYSKKKPSKEFYFRWLYGHEREDISVKKRQQKPYKSIASGNLLIRKKIFLSINKNILNNWYGYDNYFSTQLKTKCESIKHINNKVIHLGLETNSIFLQKQEFATHTIYKLYNNNSFSNTEDNGLLKTYLKIKHYKLTKAYSYFYSYFKPHLRANLLSENPKLFCLDLYRLGYFCQLTQQKNA